MINFALGVQFGRGMSDGAALVMGYFLLFGLAMLPVCWGVGVLVGRCKSILGKVALMVSFWVSIFFLLRFLVRMI